MNLFPEEYPQSVIVMPSLIALCESCSMRLDNDVANSATFKYSDGSLEFRAGAAVTTVKRIREAIASYSENRKIFSATGYFGAMAYPSVLEADPTWYTIQFWDKNVVELDDTYWIFVVPQHPDYRSPLSSINDFEMTVKFVRRLNSQAREIVVREMRSFLIKVRSQNVDNEGPVLIKNERFVVYSDRLLVVFDLSQTGQRTFNWIMVSLMAIASKLMIEAVQIEGTEIANKRYGSPRGKMHSIPIEK